MKNKMNLIFAPAAMVLLCVYFAGSAARFSGAVETAFIVLWICLLTGIGLSIRQGCRQQARQFRRNERRALRRMSGWDYSGSRNARRPSSRLPAKVLADTVTL